MKIQQLEFSEYRSTFSSFTAAKINGMNNALYYISLQNNEFEVIDFNKEKYYFSSIQEAKNFCQEHFEDFIKNNVILSTIQLKLF